jgi:eukaryotic-like serine/threonine-protein kinase
MTTPERWERIQAVFQAALEQPAEGRLAFLSDACGGDEAVRREVQSLLAALDAAGGFLEMPAHRTEVGVDAAPPALSPGDLVGNFEVLGAIGRGAMGEVYRARDRKLGRDVALKLLPRVFAADPQRLSRFERGSGWGC